MSYTKRKQIDCCSISNTVCMSNRLAMQLSNTWEKFCFKFGNYVSNLFDHSCSWLSSVVFCTTFTACTPWPGFAISGILFLCSPYSGFDGLCFVSPQGRILSTHSWKIHYICKYSISRPTTREYQYFDQFQMKNSLKVFNRLTKFVERPL